MAGKTHLLTVVKASEHFDKNLADLHNVLSNVYVTLNGDLDSHGVERALTLMQSAMSNVRAMREDTAYARNAAQGVAYDLDSLVEAINRIRGHDFRLAGKTHFPPARASLSDLINGSDKEADPSVVDEPLVPRATWDR